MNGRRMLEKLIPQVKPKPYAQSEELGACGSCPDYREYRAHARTDKGVLKISCEAQSGMVSVRTDITSFRDCEVFQRVQYRAV
jgi:hypothetical protein